MFQLDREPVVDENLKTHAYYLQNVHENKTDDPFCNSVKIIHTALNIVGADSVFEDALAFISVPSALLLSDAIFVVPSTRVVLDISSFTELDEKLLKRIERLHQEGYLFSLSIDDCQESNLSFIYTLLPFCEYIKINAKVVDRELLYKALLKLGKTQKIFIITNINSKKLFSEFKELGFSLFQGNYFIDAKFNLRVNTKVNPEAIIDIRNSLYCDEKEVVGKFEEQAELSLYLLQYVLSCYSTQEKKLYSVGQLVDTLGKERLLQWLNLVLYTTKNEKKVEKNRGLNKRVTLMSALYKKIYKEHNSEGLSKVCFTAIISKSELILESKLENLLSSEIICKDIKEAVLDKQGPLGELCAASEAMDRLDFPKIEAFMKKHELSPVDFSRFLML